MVNEKVWFITGCSTGFGRAIAEAAIKAGCKVAATARNRDAITDLTRGNEANTALGYYHATKYAVEGISETLYKKSPRLTSM
ncbi:MAG: SDR family NAD(P)-dependent oxidoreductase [Treponema sp.]|jgi:NADP-dependent 3-hydroxy acid dehydrogenase YdfG|nr:SDR family NAD(P)-dependent oxidoreductase [Treponema sp.]